jgi:hypothetical protein
MHAYIDICCTFMHTYSVHTDILYIHTACKHTYIQCAFIHTHKHAYIHTYTVHTFINIYAYINTNV